MKKLITICILLVLSLKTNFVQAQGIPDPANLLPPSFIPKSPTLSSFQRFDTQELVNLPTGAAQLSIPVAEVSSGPLTLAVSIAYSYTGLQVGQSYDLVGLGWSLQAGASITRQVNGLVDDLAVTNPDSRYNPDSVEMGVSKQKYLTRVARNQVDAAPDMYSFSLPDGTNGRFIIVDTTILLLPQQPLHVRSLGSRSPNGFPGFQITTESGIRYQFLAVETTNPSRQNFGPVGQHYTAWQLSQQISAGNTDTLRLHYSNKGFEPLPQQATVTTGQYYTGVSELLGNLEDANAGCGSTASYSFHNVRTFPSSVRAQYLDSITARGVHLIIKRNDAHELRYVQLVAISGSRREIKRFNLYQSHFGNATADYRLRLDSVRESANSTKMPAYRFRYREGITMPSRGSAAKDYWGYSNGEVGNGDYNTEGVPSLLADPRLNQDDRHAANREPNHDFVQAGALIEVRYPTGGTTRWEYEPGRIAAETVDIPLTYSHESVEASYNIATAIPLSGTRLKVSPSSQMVFQVLQEGDIDVVLYRESESQLPTGGTNTYKDFSIWHQTAASDTLITNSVLQGAYQIYDGPNDERSYVFHLTPGTYKAQVFCETHEPHTSLSIRIPYRDSTLVKLGLPGPGIRVLRTVTTALGSPPITRAYQYIANGYSSGRSLLPGFGKEFDQYEYTDAYWSGGMMVSVGYACQFINTSSDNRGYGNEFNKYDFYYNCVTEKTGSNQGSTTHYFSHLPERFNDVVPTHQQVYRQNVQQPQASQLALDSYTTYAADTRSDVLYRLLQVRLRVANGRMALARPDVYSGMLYDIHATFVAPEVTSQSRYSESGAAFVTTTLSTYDHQRLVRTATRSSTGWQIQRYKRLSDYVNTAEVSALRVHNFNPVIETQTWKRGLQSADSVLVGGHLTYYDPAWRSPQSSWSLRLSYPVAGPNGEQRVNGLYTSLQSDSRYHLDERVSYAPLTGRLVQRQRQQPHGPATVYLWGYNRSELIAQIENATYAQVLAVLSQATIDKLASAKPGTDDQVRQLLAPLRAQLPGARVTSYTHLPLVGMTSQTGPDGRTTTYEYDALGRLLRTRDEQGRILVQQEYKYARP
jgi:YD repeat-containing protein